MVTLLCSRVKIVPENIDVGSHHFRMKPLDSHRWYEVCVPLPPIACTPLPTELLPAVRQVIGLFTAVISEQRGQILIGPVMRVRPFILRLRPFILRVRSFDLLGLGQPLTLLGFINSQLVIKFRVLPVILCRRRWFDVLGKPGFR